MKRTTFFSMFLIAALGLIVATTAAFGLVTPKPGIVPCEFTWRVTAGSGNWQTASNWDVVTPIGETCNDYPQSGDTAIITDVTSGSDPVIDSNDETVATLTINSGGLLTVTSQTLTLEGSSQTFNGNLVLSDSSAIVKFTGGTIAASGSTTTGIKGEDDGAKIQIEGGDTLTSTMLIQGHLVMETNGGSGNGTFVNGATGIVRANADGGGSPAVLLLAAGLTIDDADTGTPKWEATTDPDAVLQFNTGASCLDGNFLIANCAKLKLSDAGVSAVHIKTEGGVTQTAGEIVLNNSSTLFKNLTSCASGTSVAAGFFGGCS